MLLDLAEALAEQNKVAEGLTYINQVRQRAGVALLQNTDNSLPTYVANKDELKERIRKEYRWELCGEAVSYFEELRCLTYHDAKYFTGAGLKNIDGSWGRSASVQFAWDERLMWWPIPPGEIDKNPKLTQNPGWEN